MSDLEEIRRQKKNKFATVLILVSGVGMLFIGLPSYFTPQGHEAMTVNGEDVPFDVYQSQRNAILQRQPQLEESALREQAIQSTVMQTVLQQHARQSGLDLPDERLYALVKSQFGDSQSYREALQSMQSNAQNYEHYLRGEEARKIYYELFGGLNTRGQSEEDALLQAMLQERLYRVARLDFKDFAVAEPSAADLDAHYQSHLQDYQRPAAAEIEYLHFHAEALPGLSISDEDLLDLNRQAGKRAAKYVIFGEHQRELAQDWQQKLQRGERSWADLEQAIQQKTLEAEVGDFPLQEFGQIGVQEMDEALFALQEKDAWSPLLNSSYGLMLMQLTALELPELESLRARQQQAAREQALYALGSRVLELQSEGQWAEIVQLSPTPLQTARIEQGGQAAEPVLNQAALQEALFAEALPVGSIGEAIPLQDGAFLIYRPRAYSAAEALPRAEIEARLRQDWQRTQQQQALNAKLEALRQDEAQHMDAVALAEKYGLKLQDLPWQGRALASDLNAAQLEALFASGAGLQFFPDAEGGRLYFLTALRPSSLEAGLQKMLYGMLQQNQQNQNLDALALYLARQAQLKLSPRLHEEP